ncbi:MAG: YhcH/YjgK/YiaL family protein [Paludibacter sp.]
MILDALKNAALYESVHPRFKKAFDFLLNTDLVALPLGKLELEGSDLFVNVVEIEGKSADEAKMETHNRYIDIQVPVTASETMGWIAVNQLKQTTQEYSPEKDVAFFADKATSFVNVQPYQFAIFFPEDAHQPGIAAGTHKKVIVKVLV